MQIVLIIYGAGLLEGRVGDGRGGVTVKGTVYQYKKKKNNHMPELFYGQNLIQTPGPWHGNIYEMSDSRLTQ